MPRGVYKRKKRKKRNAPRVEQPISDDLEDMHQKVLRAHGLIADGKGLINEAWDLINSIPKRIP